LILAISSGVIASNALGARLTNGVNIPFGGSVCADVAWGNGAVGTAVNAYPCHGGLNQQFYFEPDGTLRTFNGLCMTIVNGLVQTAACSSDVHLRCANTC
jgi:hypothetical protein